MTITGDAASGYTVTKTSLTGKLVVTKRVTGAPASEADKSFAFTIQNAEGKYVRADGSLSDAEVRFSLTNGASLTVENVAIGVYTVTELGTEPNGAAQIANYSLRATQTGSGLVQRNGTAGVTLNNDYTVNTGSLRIEKTFTGLTSYDDAGALRFRITGPNGYNKTVTYAEFTDGVYVLENLMPGTYMVYELNAIGLNPAWRLLKTSKTADSAVVKASETASVKLKNDYEVATTSVSIKKSWDDQNNLDGSRPTSLKVNVMNGSSIMKTVVLSEENNWMAEVTGLPLFDASGARISYTWMEETVSGYTLSGEKTLGNVTLITNKHEPELTKVTVKKIWDDNNNEDEIRPVSIWMKLSNGMSVILNEENNWTATIENLPVKVDGKPVTYTWTEQTVLGYELESMESEGDTTTFTNQRRHPGTKLTPPASTPMPNPEGIHLINHVGDCYD